MKIEWSDAGLGILLNAMLMHEGVPFHIVARRVLEPREKLLLDGCRQKLRNARRELVVHGGLQPLTSMLFDLSSDEAKLLREILADCVKECNQCDNDMQIHLTTSNPAEIEEVLNKLALR